MTALAVAIRPDDVARLTLSGVPVQLPPQLSETFDGSSVGGFAAAGSATVNSGAEGRAGAGSVRVNLPANIAWTGGRGVRQLTDLVVGRVYRIRVWVRNPSAAFTDRQGAIRLLGDGGPLVSTSVLAAGVWTELVLTWRATVTSTSLDLYNRGPTVAQATFLSFDDLTVSEATELRSIVRDDVNGGLTLPPPAPSLGARALELAPSVATHDPVVLDDLTPARMGRVTYTATTSGAQAQAVHVWPATDRAPLLSVPGRRTIALESITNYTADYTAQTLTDDAWDSEDPVVQPGVLSSPRGSLVLWCRSWAQAQEVLALYRAGVYVRLRQTTFAGMDLWHVVETLRLAPLELATEGWRWTVTVGWRRTGAPS